LKILDINLSEQGLTYEDDLENQRELDPEFLIKAWEQAFYNVKSIVLRCPTLEKIYITIQGAITNTERVRVFLGRVAMSAGLSGKDYEFKVKVMTEHSNQYKNHRTLLVSELA